MASQTPGLCATCNKSATLQCSACKDSPAYAPNDAAPTYYCNTACQVKDRYFHKNRCRNLSQRITLLRAAELLKAAMLTYRERVFELDLTRIERRDGTLVLHRACKTSPSRGAFPDGLTESQEDREAALLVNQCSTAMALLGRLTRKLLAGLNHTVLETVDLHVGKPTRPTKLVPEFGLDDPPHTVTIVKRLTVGETWIIDTTGAQYGFREVLVPFERYIRQNECRLVGSPEKYEASETADVDYFATLPGPFGNLPSRQREHMAEDQRQERKARLRFAGFVDECVVGDVLQGARREFEGRCGGLMGELRGYLRGYDA